MWRSEVVRSWVGVKCVLSEYVEGEREKARDFDDE